MSMSMHLSSLEVDARPAPTSNPPTMLTKENMVIAAKLVVVALVIAGLITACIFTGGLAAGAIAVGASAVKSGILIGVSVGFGLSAVAAPFVAAHMDMHKHKPGDDLKDTACYVAIMALGIIYAVGRCAWIGLQWGCIAECLRHR